MIYRHSKQQINEYFDKNGLNQSSIKEIIEKGVQCYAENASLLAHQEEARYYEEKEHYLVGSSVDDYITMGEEYYNNNYHFSRSGKPSDTVLSIVKLVYDILKEREFEFLPNLASYPQYIYESCDRNNYYMNQRKDDLNADNRIARVIAAKHANTYFQDLIEAGDRQVLSETQNVLINTLINNLTTHPYTEWIFKDAPDTDLVYQMPLYFEVAGVFCKALPDLVRIDHAKKMIFPIDIKTYGDYLTLFKKQIKYRRYDIQASFYEEAILNNLDNYSKLIGKDITKYEIRNFALVAESTKAPNTPLIFPLSNALLSVGKFGNGDDLKGWTSGVSIFIDWSKNNFSLHDVVAPHKGIIPVDEDFEYFHKIF